MSYANISSSLMNRNKTMERREALAAVLAMDTVIDHETQRMQQMRDNPKLGDPKDLPVSTAVERQSPVTPHMVTMSVELIARNAALKAIGGCTNYADETNAKANIEEAKGYSYEADEHVATEPQKAPTKKATK